MFATSNKIKEISGVSVDNIPEDVLTSTQPIILKQLAAHWPLVTTTSNNQCIEEIQKHYQGALTYAFIADKSTKGRYFYQNNLSELNFSKQQVALNDVLTQLATPNSQHSIYVGSSNIDALLPTLKQSHHISSLDSYHPLASIWLGNESRIAAHQDMPSNIACCIKGQRRFTLFPPDQVENLYIGPLDFTPAGQAISLVDFHQIDHQQYPNFKKAMQKAYIAELEPGDALYIPSMWWHHVEGLSNFNVLLNFWWNSHTTPVGAPIDALYHALLNIKSLPTEQKKAWQALFNHYIFNDNEQALDHIPREQQGILDSSTELSSRKIRAMLLNKLNR